MKKLLIVLSIVFSISCGLADRLTGNVLLTPLNCVTLDSDVNQASIFALSEALWKLNLKRGKDTYPLYVVINSPGGSVYDSEMFIRFANHISNVKTIVMFAASAAHSIQQGIEGERLVMSDSVMMAHRAKISLSGQINDGEVESRLKNIKEWLDSIELRISKRIGITVQDYKQKIINEWWIFGESAIELNNADRLVKVKCSPELINLKITKFEGTIIGPIPYEGSACPLVPKNNN
jgi:ATP-dependent protease ClpP protease subunit